MAIHNVLYFHAFKYFVRHHHRISRFEMYQKRCTVVELWASTGKREKERSTEIHVDARLLI